MAILIAWGVMRARQKGLGTYLGRQVARDISMPATRCLLRSSYPKLGRCKSVGAVPWLLGQLMVTQQMSMPMRCQPDRDVETTEQTKPKAVVRGRRAAVNVSREGDRTIRREMSCSCGQALRPRMEEDANVTGRIQAGETQTKRWGRQGGTGTTLTWVAKLRYVSSICCPGRGECRQSMSRCDKKVDRCSMLPPRPSRGVPRC